MLRLQWSRCPLCWVYSAALLEDTFNDWFVALLHVSVALGGPWVHDPGQGYTRVGYRYYASQEGFTEGGYRTPVFRAFGPFTEWGLPGGLQLIGDLPFIMATQRAADGFGYHHQWTGDLRLQIDWAALDNA